MNPSVRIDRDKVERLRAARGLTQKELAELAQISPRNLQLILNRSNKPTTPGTVKKLAKALGCEVSEILLTRRELFPQFSLEGFPSPINADSFVGRNSILDNLDSAYGAATIDVVQMVGDGGVGKTAVVSHWLSQIKERFRVPQIFAWSFYSQGQHRYLHDSLSFARALQEHFARCNLQVEASRGSDRSRLMVRLAEAFVEVGGVLVLDGFEPLQEPPHVRDGRIIDHEMQQFIDTLLVSQRGTSDTPRLLVLTTRWAVPDLQRARVRTLPLDTLSPGECAELFRRFRLVGDPDYGLRLRGREIADHGEFEGELEDIGREIQGHALAAVLLASLVLNYMDGELGLRYRVLDPPFAFPDQESRLSRHAERLMAAYDKMLQEDASLRSKACCQILRILAAFDRPTSLELISSLCDLFVVTEDPKPVLQELRRLRLVSWSDEGLVDAHPVVRAHFQRKVKAETPQLWRDAHSRLFEHFTRVVPEKATDIVEIETLLRAVVHGCVSQRYEDALELYMTRVQQGDALYATRTLGITSALVPVLAHFFVDNEWQTPVRRDAAHPQGLTPAEQGYVVSTGAFYLNSLGRSSEALRLFHHALELCENAGHLENAAATADSQAETLWLLGRLARAEDAALRATDLAQRFIQSTPGTDNLRHMSSLVWLGTIRLARGRIDEALEAFQEAERLQALDEPQRPRMYGLWGAFYCRALLLQGELDEVVDRCHYALQLEDARSEPQILVQGVQRVILGAALAGLGQLDPACEAFDEGVHLVKRSGAMAYVPLALLARARALMGGGSMYTAAEAAADLDECERMTSRNEWLPFHSETLLLRARSLLTFAPPSPERAAAAMALRNRASAVIKGVHPALDGYDDAYGLLATELEQIDRMLRSS